MATLTVGAGQQFARIADAVAASHDGDVIQVQAGTYVNDFATISTKISIVGVGGMVRLVATASPPDGKAILVTQTDVTLDHIEFSGASVPDENGAGIRFEGGNLVVTNCYFHDNEMHILGGGQAGSIVISNSEFGRTTDSPSLNHGVYSGATGLLKITDSYFHDVFDGHLIKSRAQTTIIENNRIDDGTGDVSYSIDMPNGGKATVRGNTIVQSANNDNASIIHFGGEGTPYAGSSLLVENNIIGNLGGSATAVQNQTSFVASIVNNKTYNVTTIGSGANTQSGNTTLSAPVVVDTSHPWADTARIHAGVDAVTTNEDVAVTLNVLANDTTIGGTLSVIAANDPAHGAVKLGAGGNLTYTPDANFFGTDSFTYTVTDGTATSAADVRITVTSVNDAPNAVDDFERTTSGKPITIDVLRNDKDPDGTTPALTNFSQAGHGSVIQNSNGTFTYTPTAGFAGTDTFNYTLSDGKLTDTAAVSINVLNKNSTFHDLIAAAPENSWIQLNLNHFKDVWTPSAMRPDVSPNWPDAVIFSWGSMAWDPNRGDLIFWGGGHGNYAGNEVYRWDSDTLMWERASLPSEVVKTPTTDNYQHYTTVDGIYNSPIASHTYDNSEFLPIVDRYVTLGGGVFGTGANFTQAGKWVDTGPYFWDPSKADPSKVGGLTGSAVGGSTSILGGQMWQNRDNLISNTVGRHPGDDLGGFLDGTTAYATENGKDVLYINDRNLWKYTVNDVNDPSKDTYQLVGIYWDSYGGQGAGAIDPSHHLYVRIGSVENEGGHGSWFTYWDLNTAGPNNPNHNFTPTVTSGQFDMTSLWRYGMDFDPVRGEFVLWGGKSDVWILKPPSTVSTAGWTLTPVPMTGPGGLPSSDTAFTGVLGKWKYIASEDIFLGVVDATNGTVWAYKPDHWQPGGTPQNPPPPPPPPPESNDLLGTIGADKLAGTTVDQKITGAKGDDSLTGGGGHDTFVINAGDGADIITDFRGASNSADGDILKFIGSGLSAANMRLQQSGADVVVTFDGVANTSVTLKGVTVASLDNLSGAKYGFAFNGEAAPSDSFDILGAVSQVAYANAVSFLSAQNDTIKGLDNSADVINGQDGNDSISGLSGDDILRGENGNDILAGGAGNDRLDGGAGVDTAVFIGPVSNYAITHGTAVTIKDLVGNDGTDTLTNMEKAQFADRTVFLDGTNNAPVAVADSATTNEDAVVTGKLLLNDLDFDGDTLHAVAQTLLSQHGASVTISADGSFTYDPRSASELQALNAGGSLNDGFAYSIDDGHGGTAAGSVKVAVTGLNEPIPSGNDGNGTGNSPGTGGNPPIVTGTAKGDLLLGDATDQSFSGGNGNDRIWGRGGDDTIHGDAGNDRLFGGVGHDKLYGDKGNDVLQGNSGNDSLDGGVGNDRLYGGAGNDALTGGAGKDKFVFGPGGDHDTITDFQAGADKIDLSAFGLANLDELKLAATLTPDQPANTLTIDFGDGDRMTIMGIFKLVPENLVL